MPKLTFEIFLNLVVPPVEEDNQGERTLDSVKRVKSLMHKNLSTLFRNML